MFFETIKMQSRNKLMCRLCLCENESFIDVFEVNDWECYVAADVISDLLQLQVSESDGYPRVICSTCLSKLTEFKLFKECCHKSRVTYDNLFASKESLAESQPESDQLQDVKREFVDIAEVLAQHSKEGVRLSFLEGQGESVRFELRRSGKASTTETRLVERWAVSGFANSSNCEDDSNLDGDEAVHPSNKRKKNRVDDGEDFRSEPTVQAVSRQSECNVLDIGANHNGSFIDSERMHAVPNSDKNVMSFNDNEQIKRISTIQAVSRKSECSVLDIDANHNDAFIDSERMHAVPNSDKNVTSFNQAEQLTLHGFPKSSDCEVMREDGSYLGQDDDAHHGNKHKNNRVGVSEHFKRNSTDEAVSRQSECNVLDVHANRIDTFIDRERMHAARNCGENVTSFNGNERIKRISTIQAVSRKSECNVLDIGANSIGSFINSKIMDAVPNSDKHLTSFNQAEQLTVHGFPKSSDCEVMREDGSYLGQDDATHHGSKHKNNRVGVSEHFKRNSTDEAVSRQSECNVLDVHANHNGSFTDPERMHATRNFGENVTSFNDNEQIKRISTIQAVSRKSERNVLNIGANSIGSFIDSKIMDAVPNSDKHLTSFNQAEKSTVHGFTDSSDCEVISDDDDSEHFRRQPTVQAVSERDVRAAVRADRNGEGTRAVDNTNNRVTRAKDRRGCKRYHCEECESSFTRNYNLQVHMRTHSGSKPYKCQMCSKKFHKAENLKIHIRGHTGERPYYCKHCGQKYHRKGGLMKHLEKGCYLSSKEG